MDWKLSETPPRDEHNEVSAIILDNGIAYRKILLYDVKYNEWSDLKGNICKYVVCWMPLK
jgi:hypothetical protein